MKQQEMVVVEPKVYCLGKMVPTDQVKPNPDNPNVHPEDQVRMLAGILEAHGWREAIIVSKRSGMVVKGHGRLQTAKQMGLKKVPVEYQDYADEQAELADMIADNRVAQHSYVDALGLGKLLKKLGDKEQKNLGYEQEEIDLLLAAEYVPPSATDRKFQVLEALKLTKDAKAIIGHAVQKFCLMQGKEIDWGEALATICLQWEAGQPATAARAAEPVKEPAKPKPAAKPAAAPITTLAPEPEPSSAQERIFGVKYTASTTLQGRAGVFVIRPDEGQERYFTEDAGVTAEAKWAKEGGYKVRAAVERRGQDLWIIDMQKEA